MSKSYPEEIVRLSTYPLAISVLFAIGFTLSAQATPALLKPLPQTLQCPKASNLHKNPQSLTWSVPGGWKSYEQSFSNHVDQLLGAQWVGATVGNIVCIYSSKEKIAFPILLHFGQLTYMPTNHLGHWGENKQGHINCISHNPADCRFVPRPKEKAGNIYQEASELKNQSSQELGF